MRYPDLIAPLAEGLVRIPMKAMRLRQTREAMLDAALRRPLLEPAELLSILKDEGLGGVLQKMDEVTLAFSFLVHKADPAVARRDLALVVEALGAKPELEVDIEQAQARSASWSDSDFSDFAGLVQLKNEVDQAFSDALQTDEEAAA